MTLFSWTTPTNKFINPKLMNMWANEHSDCVVSSYLRDGKENGVLQFKWNVGFFSLTWWFKIGECKCFETGREIIFWKWSIRFLSTVAVHIWTASQVHKTMYIFGHIDYLWHGRTEYHNRYALSFAIIQCFIYFSTHFSFVYTEKGNNKRHLCTLTDCKLNMNWVS